MRRNQPRTIRLDDAVCVIGLGRFGGSLALELMADGVEVLGVDADDATMQGFDGRLTHVARADTRREDALRALSVHEFRTVVVAIGSDVEASILTTSLLLKFGVPNIWAKAVSEPHAEILRQLGVAHVVRPETDMGRRTAHVLQGALEDYVEVGDDFVITQQPAPPCTFAAPIGELKLRRNFGVHVTGVRHEGGRWEIALPEMTLVEGDHILVAGHRRDADAFARLADVE